VQACVARQSLSAPQPVEGTQPPDTEHFSPLAQSAAPVHFFAHVCVPRQASVFMQSVAD
jgi:hypothetical protein